MDVPYIKGLSEAEAVAALARARLQFVRAARRFHRKTAVKPQGVYDWAPQPQAYRGDRVYGAIEFSAAPDLVGKTLEEARQLCEQARLQLTVRREGLEETDALGKVARQEPAPGTALKRNDPVAAVFTRPTASLSVAVRDKATGRPRARRVHYIGGAGGPERSRRGRRS